VTGAEPLLLGLLERYRQGLTRPLPFFPETSWSYLQALKGRPGTEPGALQAARRLFEGNGVKPGEREDPYVALCFRDREPLETEAFQDCARAVLVPLLEHEEVPD
jgi:exodeoxyribonuclease V gamma subunit